MIDIKRLRQDPDGTRAALARRHGPVGHARRSTASSALDRPAPRASSCGSETLKAEAQRGHRGSGEAEARRERRPTSCSPRSSSRPTRSRRSTPNSATVDDGARAASCSPSPTSCSPTCPDGDVTANRVIRTWGEVPKFDFTPKPHWDLGERARHPRPRRVAPRWRAPAFRSFAAWAPGWCARSPTSCSTCTPGSMATRKWRRRTW